MTSLRSTDVRLPDGRTLRAHDTGPRGADELVVIWHHGTPNIGLPPEPLFAASDALNIRWIGYDRPGYGGSDPRPGRSIGSAAGDVAAIADALGIERFAVVGHSGGSPHALACAALLGERVSAVLAVATLAPFDADGLDWFAGMGPAGQATLRAAASGREAKEAHEATATETDPGFVDADHAALEGAWSWFMTVVRPALERGPAPLIDDDLAYVAPWEFDPSTIVAPVMLLHGGLDLIAPVAHAEWLAARMPSATLRIVPEAGHISILESAPDALAWL
ncbi:MAG: alpha/beta hydrolase [Chloroflexi bacterium]|nr:alpha/beta hydrolase [Chloroflexota bacterium]